MNQTIQHYLSFRVGTQWYGIPLNAVIEVLLLMQLSELPITKPDLLGLMTVRDAIIPVIDLRRRFGLSDAQLTLETPILMIQTPNNRVGLVVDDADAVESIADNNVASDEVHQFPYVMGAVKLPERLLLLLDIAQLSVEAQTSS